MDRTGVPKTLLLHLLCSTASLCLYTPPPLAPTQISRPSGPALELKLTTAAVYSPQSECSLTVEPPELVVRFGDPVSLNCSNTQATLMGWTGLPTMPNDATNSFGSFLLWTEVSLSSWSFNPFCWVMLEVGQCQVSVPVTVYQPPQRVALSFRNHSGPLLEDHSGPLLEGHLYSLLCEVGAVAPAQNMTVAFYRGLRELSVQNSSSAQKTPVNKNFSLDYSVSRDDHGAQFWCEARLELGPEGPQPPPVVRSQNITANVHLSEEQVEAPPTRSSREHAGRATVSVQSQQGQRQHPGVQKPRGAGHSPGSSALVLLALLILHV
ncbi:intercellular adhesion molecule 1-like [Eucyclogobius newberryi]|uniref:intercellular adhesion molecule 1-like n=1 Tax=Eucyclogobius newberryi TaxID=166745 RepID=UPI003B5C877F